MSNCQDKPTLLPKALWEALMNLPALRYMKAPVNTEAELYEKYPDGNDKGSFSFVHNENTFYTYHPRGWNRGKWKPIAGGMESFFEIDTEFLKDGDTLIYDSKKKKFVVRSGNIWNKLIDKASSVVQINKFFNEVEEIPSIESDSGIYFVHKDEDKGSKVVEFRALYIVLEIFTGKKIIKIWNSSDYWTKEEVDERKADKKQVNDIAKSVDILAVTKAEKSVVDALMLGIRKQKGVDTYNTGANSLSAIYGLTASDNGSNGKVKENGWDVLVRNDETKGGTVEKPKSNRYNWNGTTWIDMETGMYDAEIALNGGSDLSMQDMDDLKSSKTETRLTILGGNYVAKTGNIVNGERSDRGYSKMIKLIDGMILQHFAVVSNNWAATDKYIAILLYDEHYMFVGYLLESSANDDVNATINLNVILANHPTAIYCRVNITTDKGFNVIVPEGEAFIVVDEATIVEKLSFGELNNATSILYDKPITYNNTTFTLTVPEEANARIIETNGDVLSIQTGSYVLGNSNYDGYRHVYVKRDGTFISVLHSANQLKYKQHYKWIGWVYPYNGSYDLPNLLGAAILIDGNADLGNEPTNKSEWLKSYTKNIKLQPNINNAIQAVKDIWFDFPEGVAPSWFNERTPILRSISSSKYGTNNIFRIAFMLDSENEINETYAIDYSKGWANNSVNQYRVEKAFKEIEDDVEITYVIGVNFIVDSSILLEFTDQFGNVIKTEEGLLLRPNIHKKTNSSTHSVGRFARGANVKSILIGSPTVEAYIEYNTSDRKLTIPENTRLILNDGSISHITSGIYESDNLASFVFTSIKTGEVSIIKFGELGNRLNKIYWDENLYVYIGMLNPHLREATIIGEKWKVDGNIKGIPTSGINQTVPQITNNPLPRKSTDYQLKIVFFGSSWFMNTWWYLNKIIKSAGINAKIVGFYTGGASFNQWNQRFDNDSFVDAWTSEDGSDWTKTSFRFKTALEQGWDIIAFQQGAWQAKDWSNWANEWSPLVRKVKQCCGIDTVMAFNSTWTPAMQGDLSPYPNTVEGRKAWQQDNYNNTKRFVAESGVDIISPCGALLWTMRQNATLNLGNDLATDALHPDHGLPMYALSLMFFFSIIARVYGVSLDEVIEWLPDGSEQQSPAADYAFQSVNADQRALIMKMIKLALSERFGFNEVSII